MSARTEGKVPSTDSLDNEWGQYDVEIDGDQQHSDPQGAIQKSIKATTEEDLLNGSPEPIKPKTLLESRGGSFYSKQMAIAAGQQSLNKGITASPSFQELENAIGAQLALGMNTDSSQSLEGLTKSRSGGNLRSRHSQNHLNYMHKAPSPLSARKNFHKDQNSIIATTR